MFHSLFNVSIFDINLLMFGMTLQRRKFPTNVWVHINDTCFSYPGASGMQPRDPCRPWRGTLASGHKPR